MFKLSQSLLAIAINYATIGIQPSIVWTQAELRAIIEAHCVYNALYTTLLYITVLYTTLALCKL